MRQTPRSTWIVLILVLLIVESGSLPRRLTHRFIRWTAIFPVPHGSGSSLGVGVREDRGKDLSALPAAMVRLQHQSMRLRPDGRPSLDLAEGLGTVVGQHTILTHGHYCPFRNPAYIHEAIVVTRQDAPVSASLDMSLVDVTYADPGTTLFVLPDWMRLPEAIPLGDPGQLSVGDPISVVYWDDVHGQSALLETRILTVKGSLARLEDQEHALEPGDSGGAAYNVQGELIGNVWSIGMSVAGRRLPWSEIALLPAGVGQHAR
jgi:hypothetical protein